MAKVCQVTGKRPMSGNNVSHANNRTRRRFLPNLHVRRLWVASEKRWVRLRLSQQGLRIIDKKGMKQITDTGAIEAMVDEVIANHPEQAQQYKDGQEKLLGFFVGQIMKASKGKANPGQVNQLLKEKLKP